MTRSKATPTDGDVSMSLPSVPKAPMRNRWATARGRVGSRSALNAAAQSDSTTWTGTLTSSGNLPLTRPEAEPLPGKAPLPNL
jgi:hypothetical protein